MRLNVGCGPDDWGDVRVDVDYMTQTGVKSKLNVRADAHNLPFRDKAFSEVRAWHVIEHVRDPNAVLSEIQRTGEKYDIRFPVDEGYRKLMLIAVINLDWPMFMNAYRTFRRRAHLWIITLSGSTVSDRYFEYPMWTGRKRLLLKKLVRRPFRYYYEMVRRDSRPD